MYRDGRTECQGVKFPSRNSTRGVNFEERGRAAKLLERSLMLIKVVYMAANDSC